MLRSPSQDAGKWGGVPDRLYGGILVLSPLKSAQSLGMAGLDDLDLLHFHLDIMDFLVERRKPRIHAKPARDGCRPMEDGEGPQLAMASEAVFKARKCKSSRT